MYGRLCKSVPGLVAVFVVVLVHLTAQLIFLVQTGGCNVFYFLHAVSSSAVLGLSTSCYRKNRAYDKTLVTPLHKNLYLTMFVVFQTGGVVIFLADNLEYLLLEPEYRPEDKYTVGKYLYLILEYVSQMSAPFLYSIVAFNMGIFLDRAHGFKLRLRGFRAGLGIHLEEQDVQFGAPTFAVGKKLFTVLGEQRTLKGNFSVPLLSFVGFSFLAAFLCSGSLMKWFQHFTAIQKASYMYFLFLNLVTLAFIMEASEAVECEREEAEECMNRLVIRCCRSATLAEVVRLQEIRKQLSFNFYLHACGFVTLSRRTLVGVVGVLLSYCVILYQFGINSNSSP